ncbi:MAG TPA: OmpA family protein [Polyangiaceae bacterium]|nr:OmpA family protein [Polyangiaceae bacterium]
MSRSLRSSLRRSALLASFVAAVVAAPAARADDKDKNAFKDTGTHTAKDTHGAKESKLKPTATETLVKLVVVDKDKGPIKGIVVEMKGPDGKKYYADETDETGYSELLVPKGQKYDLLYVSLGSSDIAATTTLEDKPNFTQKLTLRYKGFVFTGGAKDPPRFVLDGVTFDTGKAKIKPSSFPRLDTVVEFLEHKKSAHVEISGHTDNVGDPKANKTLSENRAKACRDYVISKGIDASRVEAVGYGDARPVAPNDSEEGRARNRRIEAMEK